ncbi:MAG: hypothetical protein RXS42_01515 [Nitrososphaeria archaeon]
MRVGSSSPWTSIMRGSPLRSSSKNLSSSSLPECDEKSNLLTSAFTFLRPPSGSSSSPLSMSLLPGVSGA